MRRGGARGVLGTALQGVDIACAAGAAVAAFCALALALMLIVEVLATSFLSWSQPWVVEYSTYLQAVVMFGGAGWALRNGGHIRVVMLFQALPAALLRPLEGAITAFALGFVGFATWALVNQALRTFDFGSLSYYPMQTPVWIPQAALAACFVLFTLALLARLVRVLIGEEVEVANTVGGTIE